MSIFLCIKGIVLDIEFILWEHFILIVFFERWVEVLVFFLCLFQTIIVFHCTIFRVHTLNSFWSIKFWLFRKKENLGYYFFLMLLILNLLSSPFRGKLFGWNITVCPISDLSCLFRVLLFQKLSGLIWNEFWWTLTIYLFGSVTPVRVFCWRFYASKLLVYS